MDTINSATIKGAHLKYEAIKAASSPELLQFFLQHERENGTSLFMHCDIKELYIRVMAYQQPIREAMYTIIYYEHKYIHTPGRSYFFRIFQLPDHYQFDMELDMPNDFALISK